jgi:hypothetical protein
MPVRTALRWTLPPLALIALAGWLSTPRSATGSADAATVQANGVGMVPSQGPAAFPPNAAGPDRLAAVEKFVAQKNAESSHESEEFVHAGWKMIDVPPPDARLVSLDPKLLKGREAELRQQIASTSISAAQVENLSVIARTAQDESTQVEAVEALGRAGDEGQSALIDLLHALEQGSPARREIAPLLRPHNLSDAQAAKMARLLDDRSLNADEKKQIAFTLSLVGLRDRSSLPPDLSNSLSPDALAQLASTASLATFTHP